MNRFHTSLVVLAVFLVNRATSQITHIMVIRLRRTNQAGRSQGHRHFSGAGVMRAALQSVVTLCTLLTVLWTTAAYAILPPERTGNFYVTNFNGNSVVVYDSLGTYLRSFTAPGLDGPRGIVFAPNSKIYVASQHSDQVFVFDQDEQFVTKFTDQQLDGPTGMALIGSAELYVCSFNNDQVVVFDLDGNMLRTLTGGGMNGPNCVAVDSDGNFYVSSALTANVIKFDANDHFMTTFTGGGLSSPMGIARDTSDVLYVAGGGSNNIVKFDTIGNYLASITHPDLTGPQGVAFDAQGHLFSSSFYLNQVVEFDAGGNYVQTITGGGLQIPRSIAFEPLETVTAITESVIPNRFTLYQNAPNPFNPATVIRYDVPAGGEHVTLQIFDVSGRLVATLTDGWQAGGGKAALWNGADRQGRQVSTGVYFYRLKARDFSETRKMLLLR